MRFRRDHADVGAGGIRDRTRYRHRWSDLPGRASWPPVPAPAGLGDSLCPPDRCDHTDSHDQQGRHIPDHGASRNLHPECPDRVVLAEVFAVEGGRISRRYRRSEYLLRHRHPLRPSCLPMPRLEPACWNTGDEVPWVIFGGSPSAPVRCCPSWLGHPTAHGRPSCLKPAISACAGTASTMPRA